MKSILLSLSALCLSLAATGSFAQIAMPDARYSDTQSRDRIVQNNYDTRKVTAQNAYEQRDYEQRDYDQAIRSMNAPHRADTGNVVLRTKSLLSSYDPLDSIQSCSKNGCVNGHGQSRAVRKMEMFVDDSADPMTLESACSTDFCEYGYSKTSDGFTSYYRAQYTAAKFQSNRSNGLLGN